MANEVDRLLTQSVIDNILETQKAIAERPQKSSVYSTVSGTETPYALADMLALRNTIGPATARLDNALKGRENFGYSLANALSSLPQQQGPGSWVSALARGFGAGYSARTNAEIDRVQKAYDAQMKDAATRLAVDKAMGGTTSKTENQSIGYNMMPYSSGDKNKNEKNQTPKVPMLTPEYWDQMISNFDEGRPTEKSYREMSQIRRNLRNKEMIAGTPAENYAREQFNAARGREFLPIARNALKGAGQITDFEDKKYTDWLNAVRDPVQLKDTAVRIVDDVAFKNNFTAEQKAQVLQQLGLTSYAKDLLEQQIKAEPARVEGGQSVDDILKEYGATRVE